MSSLNEDGDRVLADRLVSYADAIAAVSFVGVSGLGIAVADPETRESIARAAIWVAAFNLFLGAFMSALLLVLRRWETDLRTENRMSAKAALYSRRMHWARLAVVWVSAVQAATIMLLIR